MIVRWGLDALPEVCAEAGLEEPLLVASKRWELPIAARARWSEVPSERIEDAAAQAAGGVIALGGGSAVDLGKAISAKAGVSLVSVPTT
jgi:glycerol dehydrogenase-like iron-containing ADH family enzyme